MIANLTRGAKIASLHLPADRFQIAGVLSYLGVDRLDDYDLPCEGQDSSGIMVSLEPTGIAERNIAGFAETIKSPSEDSIRASAVSSSCGKRVPTQLPAVRKLQLLLQIVNILPQLFVLFLKRLQLTLCRFHKRMSLVRGIFFNALHRLCIDNGIIL